jgi:monoamine oxidase
VRERIETDVCVVGAGYAGLTAARRLAHAERSVVVLEARDRVGGRVWTAELDDGTRIDRGGAWLAPRHGAIFRLAGEVGVDTYKTYVAGKHLLVDHGRLRRYTGLIPKISPVAVATIARAQLRVDRMSKEIPLDSPWTAPHAVEWDNRTVAWWMERTGIRSGIGQELFEMAVRGLMTGDLNDVSLLHLLTLVRGHGSINSLFSIENGAQENLVVGGAGSIAARVAAELPEDCLRLNTPVRAITHGADHVTVGADGQRGDGIDVEARDVIVAIPPALIADIAFDPPLPADRAALYRSAVAGPETKTLLVYDEPFWRLDGFSGQTSEPGSPAEVTIDATPATGRPGVIAAFTFSQVAERLAATPQEERFDALRTAMRGRLGPRAGSPRQIVETAWWSEEWTRGCSFAHLPPGALTRHGHLIRQPMGRVHWAGSETSFLSHGAIDGAVRSAERAAVEIISAGVR